MMVVMVEDVTGRFVTANAVKFYDDAVEEVTTVPAYEIENVTYYADTDMYALENMDGLVFEFTEYELIEEV